MSRVIFGRLLFMIPAGLFVITLAFAMFHLVPGDPVLLMVGDTAPPEVIEQARKEFGFDKPLYVQYVVYISRIVRGNFGTSYYSRVPVTELIFPRFLNTLQVAVLATMVGISVSLVLGSASSMWHGSIVDTLITMSSLVGICMPTFLTGLIALYVFSVQLGVLPVSGMHSWKSYVLPVLNLGFYQVAFLTRMIRTCMIDALGEEYICTARAKGVTEYSVVFRHALKNALLPIITVIGLRFGYALGGAVVTEVIFTWPGLGRLIIDSVLRRDLLVTQGALFLFAGAFIMVNLTVDVLYTFVDPRVRYD
jgi:ABC-type dipeptide/oligopeptide/nickel transport system permease component